MPDMMNFAYNVDVYTIWADMVKYNKCFYDIKRQYWVHILVDVMVFGICITMIK